MAGSKATISQPAEFPVISIREFAGRFSNGVRISQQPFTWFLGAGCSRSSGILDAGGLVDKWLRELAELQGVSTRSFAAWVQGAFPSYDSSHPSLLYANAFARRHPSPVERQREIEMICSRGEPAYGYATLAQVLSHKDYGRFCNTVLTTNFDDLIADALYLYGERNARPLVVTHEALARYVRTNSPRPTVVKLHGDAHLDPKNLQPETREIDTGLAKQLYPFLQDHALIFVGYGGNDESILKFVAECPIPALAPPIYWVSKREPPARFGHWLHQRSALRVDHTDFDQLMHLIRGGLNIELLDRSRWTQIGDTYYGAFERLRVEIDSVEASAEDTQALQAATTEVAKSLPDDWSYYEQARRLAGSDRVRAEETYREGLEKFPNSAMLNGNFAIFLEIVKQDYDDAEIHYNQALKIDPRRPSTLTNYAIFVQRIRKNSDEAEALHRRAIEADPNRSYSLSRYARFVAEARGELDRAETLFKEAIQAGGRDTDSLISYARFQADVGKNLDAAEALYKEAIEADPKDAGPLRSFALFLEENGRLDEADACYRKGIDIQPVAALTLSFYGDFLEKYRKDYDAAENLYKQALAIAPEDGFTVRRYARFLETVRQDSANAKKFRERTQSSKINEKGGEGDGV